MNEEQPIENKIVKSGLIILEMSRFIVDAEIHTIDIADKLWEGIALKEKDFRQYISETDWEIYRDQYVAVFCSADAIIPNWAYMLIASALTPFTQNVYFGTKQQYASALVLERIETIDLDEFRDQRVMIKGCGNAAIDFTAFGNMSVRLTPVVKSLMFGEPCGMVPVYKRK